MATRRARLQIRPNVGPKARPAVNGKPLESGSKDVEESLAVSLVLKSNEVDKKQTSDVSSPTDGNIKKENEDRTINKQTNDVNPPTDASILIENVVRDVMKQITDVNSATEANILKENVDKDIGTKISRDSLMESCEKNNNSIHQVTNENIKIKLNDSEDDVSYSDLQQTSKDESQSNFTASQPNDVTLNSIVNIKKENAAEKRPPSLESDKECNINPPCVVKPSLLKESKKSRVLPLRSRFPKAKPNILSINRLRGTKPLPVPEPEEKCMMGANILCSTPLVPDHPTNDKGPNLHVAKIPCKSLEKDETPSRRRRRYIKGNKPPERSKMTMRDLIYWNPSNNPMISSTDDAVISNEEEIIELPDIVEDDPVEEPEPVLESEGNNSAPVPQVKVAADGSIVINEESLVVEAAPKKKNMNNSPVIYEKSSCTTYTSFRKRTNTKIWTEKETARFYKALSTVGTDFSLMNNMFLKRTRSELKNKFKKEERVNKTLVDKAIRERQHFDESIFEPSSESDSDVTQQKKNIVKEKKLVLKRIPEQKEIKENNSSKVNLEVSKVSLEIPAAKKDTRKKPVRKQKKIDLPAEEIHLDSAIEEIQQSSAIANKMELVQIEEEIIEKDDLNSEANIFTSIHRPTRSGRQPKRSHVFTIDIPGTRPRKIRQPERRHTETIPQVIAEAKAEQQSSSACSSGGQLLLITGESNDASNTQVIHVYMISPPNTGQLTSLDLTSILNQAVLTPNSETTESQPTTLLEQLMFESDTLGDGLTTVVVSEMETITQEEIFE